MLETLFHSPCASFSPISNSKRDLEGFSHLIVAHLPLSSFFSLHTSRSLTRLMMTLTRALENSQIPSFNENSTNAKHTSLWQSLAEHIPSCKEGVDLTTIFLLSFYDLSSIRMKILCLSKHSSSHTEMRLVLFSFLSRPIGKSPLVKHKMRENVHDKLHLQHKK